MRAVVQRVNSASLSVVEVSSARHVCAIEAGLVVLAGVETGDGEADRAWMASKIVHLRIFEDEAGRMNRSVLEVGGEILLVSNFTVAGDARKGRRPSFDGAMRPGEASRAFDALVDAVRGFGVRVATGEFGAHMHVVIENDGPVTIWLDSRGGEEM